MGMFDYVHYKGEVHQTKEFDCEMINYWVEGGRLIKSIGEYVSVPKAERPYPNAPDDDPSSMCGCIKWVESERRDINFHGMLYIGDYVLKFTDGNLVEELS